MPSVRIPLAALMGLVFLCAVGFTALRAGSELWFSTVYTLTVVLLLWATLAARFHRRNSGAFWFGFTVVGWGVLLVGLGVRPMLSTDTDDESLDPLVNQRLLTTRALKRLQDVAIAQGDLEQIGKYGNSIAIGHVLLTSVLATVGGALAVAQRQVLARQARERRVERATPRPIRRASRKSLFWGAAATLALAAIVGVSWVSPSPQGPYFPDLGLAPTEDRHEFFVNWYTKHLEAMNEPSLWALSQSDPKALVYRFLWLPSFHHPVCVRIARSGDDVTLNAIVLDGRGGYEPGSVAVNKTRTLSRSQWDELMRHATQADFWSLPTRDDSQGGSDGDQFIVEGVADGRYHVVDRWSPDSGPYYELCRHMLDLSGLTYKGAWKGYHGEEMFQ